MSNVVDVLNPDGTDPRAIVTPIPHGTKLRDAAVDPRASDFNPPINAGTAGPAGNPHGKNVRSVPIS